jgi:hypothetical protein
MCSPSLIRPTATRTALLVQAASSEICSREKGEAEFRPLHVDWRMVADKKGDPRPRMHWRVE